MKPFILLPFTFILINYLAAQENLNLQILNEVDANKVQFLENTPGFRGPTNNSLEELLNLTFDSIANLSPLKGMNAAINLPDGTIWRRAKGLASSDLQDSLNVSHAMGMGSTTKTFTAVTILLLQEEGLLHINDPIGNYLPDNPNIDSAITIRQLLQHTSGIYNYTDHPDFSDAVFSNPTYIWSPDEIIENFVLAPLFLPGTSWSYSNTNYLLAGMIIEAVTNQSYYAAVRSRILNPLGLTHTFCYPQETLAGPFADVWLDIDGNGTKEVVQDFLPLTGYFSAAYSAGALVTTPEDLALFFKKLLNQEILQSSTYNEMFFLYPLEPSGTFGYGLGIYNSQACNQMGWGHNGYIIYQSDNLTLPNEDYAISVLSNDGDTDPDIIGLTDMKLALADVICNFEPVGLDDQIAAVLTISPNPVTDYLEVTLPEEAPYQVVLTDMTGKRCLIAEFSGNSTRINTENLVPGVYVLQLISTAGTYYSELIVKNK